MNKKQNQRSLLDTVILGVVIGNILTGALVAVISLAFTQGLGVLFLGFAFVVFAVWAVLRAIRNQS